MRGPLACLFLVGCGSTHVGVVDDGGAGADATSVTDGAIADGGTPIDGATGSDAGAGFCATRAPQAAFCDDFDRGALGASWDFVQLTAPGVATLDMATFLSAPSSLGLVTPKLESDVIGTILLRKTVKGGASRAVLGFDLYSDEVQATGNLAIATLDLALNHLFTLYLRDDDPNTPGATLSETPPDGGAIVRHPFAKLPPAGGWTHVEIDLDAANGQGTLRFDGAVVVTAPIAKAPPLDPTIRIGILVTGPAASYTMRFENTTLDVIP